MIEDVVVVDTVVENPRLIVVPSISIETDNKRFSSQSIDKIWASVDVAVAWDEEVTVRFEAESSYAFVRVLWLKETAVFFDVVDGYAHGTSDTASVVEVAVHELLFWEALEFTVEDLAGGFETGYCGECPARSAFSLVLNGSNGALDSPVNIYVRNKCVNFSNGWLVNWLDLWSVVSLIGKVGLGELLLSQGWESIDSSSVWSGGVAVMLLDEDLLFSEQFESVKVFEVRIVLYVEILFPLVVFCENGRWKLKGIYQVVYTKKHTT